MPFDRNNFAQIAGAELSPDTKQPLIFTYYAGQDSVAVCLSLNYFGVGVNTAGYDSKTSVTTLLNRGTLIFVNSDLGSGAPATQFTATLLVMSEQNEDVEMTVLSPWVP